MTMTQTKPFRLLTARDLMTRDLLLIPKEASLRHAAHMLAQSQVSGAPVVDEAGCCIGVLSTTDFMRWMDDEPRRSVHTHQACCCSDWEIISPESLPADEVGTFMTHDPITVPPEIRIGALARMMLDAHIHRVIVVDAERHPIGVVTSTDVLAAVARSMDPE
jgi:CBS-domain-containing membrane protein